jgi:hypothetical protein
VQDLGRHRLGDLAAVALELVPGRPHLDHLEPLIGPAGELGQQAVDHSAGALQHGRDEGVVQLDRLRHVDRHGEHRDLLDPVPGDPAASRGQAGWAPRPPTVSGRPRRPG